MPFEFELRERLHDEAASFPLPARDPRIAASRAKTLRRHRKMLAAGMVAVSAAVVLGAPLLLAHEDGDKADVTHVAEGLGLPATGPLDLSWQTSDGGILWPSVTFQGADGVVYAVSTVPGRVDPGNTDPVPRTIYRMNDDGTWEPIDLDGDRAVAADVASGGDDLLYAVSTAPDDAATLSTSSDGGASWTDHPVEAAPPPNDTLDWNNDTVVSVETNGSTVLATVNTAFYSDFLQLFPEANGDNTLTTMTDEEGITLTRMPDSWGTAVVQGSGADGATSPTTAPAEVIERSGAQADTEKIRTIPWSDIGLDGPGDLSSTRFFRWDGDSWEPQEVDFGAGGDLSVAGDQFVFHTWNPDGTESLWTSADGSSWQPVSVPADSAVVGVGPALVAYAWGDVYNGGGPKIQVSVDGGGTWEPIDLAAVGADPNSVVRSASGGPLGLAVVLGPVTGPNSSGGGTGPWQLLVSGDLESWTATNLTDIVDNDAISDAQVFVGADRMVVSMSTAQGEGSPTFTAIGTPTRN